MAEWQRITNVYRGMYDDELINLVADQEDLTDIARQVLDLELKRRGLGDLSHAAPTRPMPEPKRERRAVLLGNQGGAPQLVLDYRKIRDNEAPLEYTWKTPLCECESMEQAKQWCAVLQRAGIDNWIEEPGSAGLRYKEFVNTGSELSNPRILVAADQLENARAIISNPIPEEVVVESKLTVPEFEMPKCPRCGAGDPALEGVNPFNSWRCEACGYQWSESAGAEAADPANEFK
jgi:hypothetical protein